MKRWMKYTVSSCQKSSLAPVLVGDFNLPDVCWKYNKMERKQSRKFLERMEDDNFLT